MLRKVNRNDAASIQLLNKEELGYDYDMTKTLQIIEYLMGHQDHVIFVFEKNKEVLGYVHGQKYYLTYSDPMVDVLGIAVARHARRLGVGKALLNALEDWTIQCGCCGIRLVSGIERKEAHAFYNSCDFEGGKNQINFKKWLKKEAI